VRFSIGRRIAISNGDRCDASSLRTTIPGMRRRRWLTDAAETGLDPVGHGSGPVEAFRSAAGNSPVAAAPRCSGTARFGCVSVLRGGAFEEADLSTYIAHQVIGLQARRRSLCPGGASADRPRSGAAAVRSCGVRRGGCVWIHADEHRGSRVGWWSVRSSRENGWPHSLGPARGSRAHGPTRSTSLRPRRARR
jgi:hypothetical protein